MCRGGVDVVEVVGVHVDQLHREVALRIDRRNGEDDGLCPQVHPQERVGRVRIGRDDRRVLGREHIRGIPNLVEGGAEVRTARLQRLGMHGLVALHHREAPHVGFLGDRTGLFGRDALSSGRRGRRIAGRRRIGLAGNQPQPQQGAHQGSGQTVGRGEFRACHGGASCRAGMVRGDGVGSRGFPRS